MHPRFYFFKWSAYSNLRMGCFLSGMLVNSHVPTTVRHGYSLHRIFPKLSTQVPDVCPSTNAETIDSSPSRLESLTSVRRLTLKLFGSSPSRLSFDRRRNFWLTSHLSVLRPSQPLMTCVLDVCPPTVTENKCRHLSALPKTRIAIMSSLSY